MGPDAMIFVFWMLGLKPDFSLSSFIFIKRLFSSSSVSALKARIYIFLIYFCFTDYIKAFDCVDHNKLWKILKEMRIPDHLTCLLRNLYAGQEATTGTRHETINWFQIGKGVCQSCILSPCLFNFYAEYIMPGWMEHKLESRLLGEISITSYMQITPPYGIKQRGTKELLIRWKKSEKADLKLDVQRSKIMASGPITSW